MKQGIVSANGPGDQNALYGECNSQTDIAPGFLYKADALREAGVPLRDVRSVDVVACQVPWGIGGWLPDDFERWDCHTIPSITPWWPTATTTASWASMPMATG